MNYVAVWVLTKLCLQFTLSLQQLTNVIARRKITVRSRRFYKCLFCVVGLSAMVSTAYAAPADMPAEIQAIQAGTAGYITGISYIVGAGSGAVGVWKFVETQSLKVAAIAGSVSILAFKFPGWVTAAAVI